MLHLNETLTAIGAVLGILVPAITLIFWHFRIVNCFKEQVADLKLQLKKLESSHRLQQQTTGRLSELYPVLNAVLEKLNKERK